jgi:hypothetical protein
MLRRGIRGGSALTSLPPEFTGEAAALPCPRGLEEGVKRCCNFQLDSAKQQQNHHYYKQWT